MLWPIFSPLLRWINFTLYSNFQNPIILFLPPAFYSFYSFDIGTYLGTVPALPCMPIMFIHQLKNRTVTTRLSDEIIFENNHLSFSLRVLKVIYVRKINTTTICSVLILEILLNIFACIVRYYGQTWCVSVNIQASTKFDGIIVQRKKVIIKRLY